MSNAQISEQVLNFFDTLQAKSNTLFEGLTDPDQIDQKLDTAAREGLDEIFQSVPYTVQFTRMIREPLIPGTISYATSVAYVDQVQKPAIILYQINISV